LDVDVVHDHSFLGPMMAWSRSAPTIITVHTTVEGELAEYYRSFGSKFRLVAISDRQRQLAPELPWFDTVRNGIPVADYPFREHKEEFVLFVGRMSPDKAPHLAIEAARGAGLPLIIAAKCTEVHEFEYFEKFVKPELGHDVEYIGEADTITKKDLLGRARALVCPMQWEEPFGIVMVEALSCGTPVVAFNRGAVSEIVQHGVSGIICKDVEGLSAAINESAKIDPKECRKRAEDLFDTAPMVAGYEAVYQRAILEEGSV
jgi:glycosyltransferase involved in cell wall biosynthesis